MSITARDTSRTITVIGATGMVGRRVVEEARARGHLVTAVARRTGSITDREGLRALAADATDPASLATALEGADTVVLTVRLPPGQEATLTPLTAEVLEAAARAGARVVVVGGAGALRSPEDPDRLLRDDERYVPASWRPLAAAGVEQLATCRRRSQQDWTYLSPPALLEDGPRTGGYRRGKDTLLTDTDGVSRISAADLAIAVLDEIERPGPDRHWTVARIEPRDLMDMNAE